MHVLFPRYYRMLSADGALLLSGSALWTLINAETRTFIFPQQEGIDVPGVVTGNEISLPSGLRSIPATQKRTFTVPYSHTDINGHMNNTRYFDLAEDRMPEGLRGRPVRLIQTEYAREARLGDTIELQSAGSADGYCLCGQQNGAKLFRLSLAYGSGKEADGHPSA